MLLDNFMPVYDFNEIHAIVVQASPDDIFQAIKELTPKEMPPFRVLFGIQSLQARGKGELGFASSHSLLDLFLSAGFVMLAEEKSRELVLGTVGRFWSWTSAPPRIENAKEFLAFDRPYYAKATLNFYVDESHGDAGVRVSSETRVYAADPLARKRFAAYWRLIHPASAFSRRVWLKAIKRRAEQSA